MDLKSDIEGADLIQRGRAFHKLFYFIKYNKLLHFLFVVILLLPT